MKFAIRWIVFMSFLMTISLTAQWQQISSSTGTKVHGFAVSGSDLFVGTETGVFHNTINGVDWTAVNNGLTNTTLTSLIINGTNLFAGTKTGMFLSTNNGSNWSSVNTGLTSANKGIYVNALIASGSDVLLGSDGGGVFLTTNSGSNWTTRNTGLPAGKYIVQSLGIKDTTIYAGTSDGAMVCGIIGKTWSGDDNGMKNNSSVSGITYLDTLTFAGTYFGVYVSKNRGGTWTSSNSGIGSSIVKSMATSGNTLFCGTNAGVFISVDTGKTWQTVNTGLGNTYIYTLTAIGTDIYAGTDDGVWKRAVSDMILPVELTSFTTIVEGKNITLWWKTATETNNYGFEIERRTVNNCQWRKIGFMQGNGTSSASHNYSFTDQKLPAGTYVYRLKQIDNGGLFKYSQETEVEISTPTALALSQNYPEPFNPSTQIDYSIPQSFHVTLKIYDVLGKDVATLVEGTKEAGTYTATWNAQNHSSGVYFYRLTAGSYTMTRKLILLR